MSRFRRAAIATMVAQAFNWTGLLLSLVTVPLYLEWLGQERYGILLTGVAFASYLMFTDLGLTWGAMLLIAQANGRDDKSEIRRIVRTSFVMSVLSAIFAVTIVAGCHMLLASTGASARWLPVNPETPGLVIAVGASVACSLLFSPFFNLFTGLQEAYLTAIYQGSARLLGTLCSVIMAYSGTTLGWVFGANAFATAVIGLLAAAHCLSRHRWAFRLGPCWDADQFHKQLATGLKTFGMQVGNVMWGTAPILAIGSGAGPQYVPLYSIPVSLLNAPVSILNSLSACMQPGYGEAIGGGEREWISQTVRRILRHVFVVLGLLGCGFLLLASQFITLWTGGTIKLEPSMLVSVLAVACVSAAMTVFRFALTGINQHRRAAASELACGGLAILLTFAVVWRFGYMSFGIPMLVAAFLTSGRILPRELRSALNEPLGFWPQKDFLLRWGLTVGGTYIIGLGVLSACRVLPASLEIVLVATACVLVFLVLMRCLLQSQVIAFREMVRLTMSRSN
jgi:O-antigen/teichoic acid export membrane protein